MKEIPLTQGKVAQVSDHRFDYLNQWKWHATSTDGNVWYAARRDSSPSGRGKVIYMHREITGAPKGVRVDHRDGDGLNNQDDNLRFADSSQNRRNSKHRADASTAYKGVQVQKLSNKYAARLKVGKKNLYLGSFETPEEAARAYDEKAKELFGEFARTNF